LKIGATLIPLVGWGFDVRSAGDARLTHLRAVRRLVEDLGLQAIELNGDFSILYPEVFESTYYEQVADLQEELGFACTVHLPFLWLDGLSLADPVRRASVECVARALEWSNRLSVETYVLHLWGMWSSMMLSVQQMQAEERRRLLGRMLAQADATLEEIGDLVPNRKLCVENLERFPFQDIEAVIQRKGVRMCLDVGHLAVSGADVVEFLDRHWDTIGEVHLHDALPGEGLGPGTRDHLALGRGGVDYVRVMDCLAEGGYDKVVILELNSEAELLESLEKVRPWM
jgi:sugar phosphate isomerase/epimerase